VSQTCPEFGNCESPDKWGVTVSSLLTQYKFFLKESLQWNQERRAVRPEEARLSDVWRPAHQEQGSLQGGRLGLLEV